MAIFFPWKLLFEFCRNTQSLVNLVCLYCLYFKIIKIGKLVPSIWIHSKMTNVNFHWNWFRSQLFPICFHYMYKLYKYANFAYIVYDGKTLSVVFYSEINKRQLWWGSVTRVQLFLRLSCGFRMMDLIVNLGYLWFIFSDLPIALSL